MLLESLVLQTLSVRSTIPEVTVIETETIKIMLDELCGKIQIWQSHQM